MENTQDNMDVEKVESDEEENGKENYSQEDDDSSESETEDSCEEGSEEEDSGDEELEEGDDNAEESDESEDDDWETDNGEDERAEDEETENEAGPSSTQQSIEDSSDSGGDDSIDRCPICLCKLRDQDVGTPESCDHTFCLECIQEWSKNVNTCPVDRQVYRLILAKHSQDGVIFKRIPVENKSLQLEEEAVEDQTFCEVCGQANREDRLLLCDSCDLGYHCECLTPALRSVPVGEWFCPTCTQAHEHATQQFNITTPRRRRIARTLVSERVRAVIAEARARGGRRVIVSDSESEEEYLQPEEEVAVASTSRPRGRSTTGTRRRTTTPKKRKTVRRKTTKKRKTTRKRKRKAPKKEKAASSKTATSKKTTKRRRKRRTKKRKGKRLVRTKSTTPSTVKKRLAGRLGLSKPPAGRSIPMMKEHVERSLDSQRTDLGLSSLSILGHRDDLDPYYSDEDVGSGGLGVIQPRARNNIYSRAALKSCCTIPYTRPRNPVSSQPRPPSPKLADEAGGFDLLGSIMMGTSLLFTKSENVIIRRDGSLEQKKGEKGSLTVNNNKTNFGKRCNDPHTPSDSPQDNGGSQQGSSPQSPSSTTSDQQGQDAGNSNDGGDAEGGSVGSSDNAGDDEGVMDLTPQHNDSPSYDKEESNGEKNGQDNEKQDSDNEKQDSDNEKQDSDNEKQDSDNEKQVSDNEKQDSDNEKQDSDNEKQDSDSDNDNESVVKREKEESEASNDKDQSDNEMQDPEKPQADDSGKEENEDDKKEVNIQSNDEINESTDQQQAQLKGQETSPSKKSRGEELYDPLEADSDDMDIESQNSNEGGDQNKKSMEQDDPLEAAMEDCIDEVDPKKESFENQEQEDDIKYEERDDQEGDESHEAQNEGDDENQEEELEGDGSEGDMIEEEEEDTKTPISELPRIPKIRKKEVDTEGEGEGPAPHRSVLDRLGSRAEPQVSSYPHWEKRERYREREGKERREKDRGEEDDYRGNDADDIERHRHKHKHRDRDRDRDKERSYDREKKSKDRDRERERARDSGVEELGSSSGKRKRRRHSRSRSKDRRRDRSERSDRSRSHSRDHRRRSRDRSRDRKRDKNRGGSNERERKHKRRSRSRSPRSHHRHGDREDRGDSHRDRSGDRGVDDYKASVKLFSQSLKEASEGDNSSGRRFKLKRNFYQGQNMEQVQEVPKKSRFEDIEIESPRPIVPPPPREEIQRRLESRVEPIINKLRPHRAPPYVDENSMSPDITEPAEVLQFSPKPPTKEAKEPSSPPPRTPPHRSPPRKSPFKKDIEKSRSSFEKSRPPFKSEVQKVVTSSKVDDSYDPSEPTEDLTPEMSPEMNSPTHAEQPLMNVPTSLMAAMPPTSRDDLVKMSSLGKPLDMHHQPGPRVAGPTNMMLHPMRMGMLQPGMPHGGQQPLILNHPMLVNAPPPPFTRGLHHLGPARIRWPPNVLIQNRLHGPGSQNGMQHRPGERIMLENPPLPGMRPGMHRGPPPPPGMPPGMSERREMASAPPPLPAKALQEMEQISQLLNAQAKLAQMMPGGRPMRPPLHHGNVFKVPMAPSHNMDARHQNKPSADNAETMEVVDMDVASPLSDDDLVMSFSPPPEKQDKDHDRKDKDKKGESSKSILSELNKEDEVPTSAVELDKHQKANKFMKKLNRQERVVEEVKLAIKPHYSKGRIDKDEYKEIMRKAVPKICHSKSGDINPVKIRSLVEAYVEKIRKMKKYMAKKDPGQQANGIQKPKQ